MFGILGCGLGLSLNAHWWGWLTERPEDRHPATTHTTNPKEPNLSPLTLELPPQGAVRKQGSPQQVMLPHVQVANSKTSTAGAEFADGTYDDFALLETEGLATAAMPSKSLPPLGDDKLASVPAPLNAKENNTTKISSGLATHNNPQAKSDQSSIHRRRSASSEDAQPYTFTGRHDAEGRPIVHQRGGAAPLVQRRGSAGESPDWTPEVYHDFNDDVIGNEFIPSGTGIAIAGGSLRIDLGPDGFEAVNQTTPVYDDMRMELTITFDEGSGGDITLFFGADEGDSRLRRRAWSGYEVKFGGPDIRHTRILKFGRNLAISPHPPELKAGIPHHLVIERQGPLISVAVNGQPVMSYQDPQPITIEGNGSVGALLWHLDAQIDDWQISAPGLATGIN
ncbi:MAG: hypothetical protein F6K62_17530 [Sphaerospermopsis sp. SIO1G2]|nr:hypothetical protein [Sphaerospermopsis sp. SIO1G2]